jgi:phage repressor protein C with HTH and peptisase S24 domain
MLLSGSCYQLNWSYAHDRTKRGEVMAKILQRQTPKTVELASFNPDQELKSVATEDVVWMARIIWASQ